MPGDEGAQAGKVLRLFFEFEEGDEFAFDESEVELFALALEDAPDVLPIAVAAGKSFVHDEVFGRAGSQFKAGLVAPKRAAGDGGFLERERAQGDVDGNAIGVLKKEDAVALGELSSIGPPRVKTNE